MTSVALSKTLGEITQFILDGTHGSPVRTVSGVPVLSAMNVKGGRLSYETDRFTSLAELDSYQRRLDLQVGDVLLTIVGTIGRTAVVDLVRPHVFQRSVAVLRPQAGVLDSRYLFHALNSSGVARQLVARTKTSAQSGVYLGALKGVSIPLPPLPEQRRIADMLDKADAIRRKRKEAIALTEELLRSAFLEMFGDPRIEGSRGLVHAPRQSLGRLVEITTGKLDANAAVPGGRYPFFTCARDALRIDVAAFEGEAVLVAGNGDLNVKYYAGRFNAYQRTYVITSKDADVLAAKYLFAFMDLYVSELRRQAIGGVIKYIKLPYLTEAQVPVPLPTEQARFCRLYDQVSLVRRSESAAYSKSVDLFTSACHQAFEPGRDYSLFADPSSAGPVL